MKLKNKLAIILSLILALNLLVACGEKPESKLIGEWSLTEDVNVMFFTFKKGSKVEFYKNGDVDFLGTGSKYEIVEGKIKMTNEGETDYYEYEIEDDILTISAQGSGLLSSENRSFKFKKIK